MGLPPYDCYRVNTDGSHRAYFGRAAFGGLIEDVHLKFVKWLYFDKATERFFVDLARHYLVDLEVKKCKDF